jgi:hypothetical protein
MDIILRVVTGFFAFASIIVRFVDDSDVADPKAQLSALLKVLYGIDDVGLHNPLQALDHFYGQIFSQVPAHSLPTTLRILACCISERESPRSPGDFVVKNLWIFLGLEQAEFYSALKKLHSVIKVPSVEDVLKEPLSFYHKSLLDYLSNPHRSGKFSISERKAGAVIRAAVLNMKNHVLVCSSGPECELLQLINQFYFFLKCTTHSLRPCFTTDVKPQDYLHSSMILGQWGVVDHFPLQFPSNVDVADSYLVEAIREFRYDLLTNRNSKDWSFLYNFLSLLFLKVLYFPFHCLILITKYLGFEVSSR